MATGNRTIHTHSEKRSTFRDHKPSSPFFMILPNLLAPSFMTLPKYFAVCFCAFLFLGCATPVKRYIPPPGDYVPLSQIQIASRFASVDVTRETLGIEVQKCIPLYSANAENIQKRLEDFPSRKLSGFGHAGSSKTFVLFNTTGFCLEQSSEKFPIFAAEAFINTVNPKGVPPDVTDGWYKQIALLIASKGMARIAYVFGNGNAFIASYWVDSARLSVLYYSNVFGKAGTWESENIDARFSHPTLTSISETKISGSSEKRYLLAHRIN